MGRIGRASARPRIATSLLSPSALPCYASAEHQLGRGLQHRAEIHRWWRPERASAEHQLGRGLQPVTPRASANRWHRPSFSSAADCNNNQRTANQAAIRHRPSFSSAADRNVHPTTAVIPTPGIGRASARPADCNPCRYAFRVASFGHRPSFSSAADCNRSQAPSYQMVQASAELQLGRGLQLFRSAGVGAGLEASAELQLGRGLQQQKSCVARAKCCASAELQLGRGLQQVQSIAQVAGLHRPSFSSAAN